MKGNRQVIVLLMSKLKESDINLEGVHRHTPLHRACEVAAVDTVEFLLETYPAIDLNARNRHGATPQHLAVSTQRANVKPEARAAVVRLLLDRGAKLLPDVPGGKTPLDLAKEMKDKTILAAFEKKPESTE